jgi:hypothetical protein
MRDLWIHESDLIVATHGRTFWVLDDIAPLREAASAMANAVHLFAPASAYRVQRDTYTDTPLPPDEPAAANPPDGAILDYYLPAAASTVTLEIRDAQGHTVRRFSSTDKPDVTDEELQKQLIPLYWVRAPGKLSTDAGMHRWIWDLHYPAPTSARHDYPISAIPHDTPRFPLGATALPGKYSIRLTVDGKTSTAPLIIKMDPRVKTSVAGLQKKFQAETRMASVMTESGGALRQGGSIRAQLEKLSAQPSANASPKEAIEAFEKKLTALLGASGGFLAPPSPEVTLGRLNGQASTLYTEIWRADAEPTAAQMEALSATEREREDVLKRWNDFRNSDLPGLNRVLRDSNLPEVQLQADLHQEEAQEDEE